MKNIALKKEKYSNNKQDNITISTKITNFIKKLTNFHFKNFCKTKPLEKTRGLSTLCKVYYNHVIDFFNLLIKN